ncbi:MAG: leucyl aminopeptidase [Pseudomonadota bacterium]
MQFGTKTANPVKTRCQCLVLGVLEGNELAETTKAVDKASGGYLQKVLGRGEMAGKVGQSVLLHDVPGINAQRVLLVGCGNAKTADAARFVQIANTTIGALKQTPATSALVCLLEIAAGDKDLYWKTRRLVERFEDGVYQFLTMKGQKPEAARELATVDLLIAKGESDVVQAGIDDGTAVALGVRAHKDVANLPGNVCTPTYLAEAAQALGKKHASVTTTVLEEKDMKKLGMGSLLSVSQGSAQPAKLIVMHHKGGKPKDAPHVLVGKGITFDSGGISIKPGQGMEEMIFDMCGAASVLGTMTCVAEQQLPINVVGVIVAAENMPSGTASRPGDIVKSMSGQTIEIINTDAEGRLVLCDALTYIDKFKPATVIDIATLTGAAVVALGSAATALYANDEDLAADLITAGEDTQDRVWRMPLWEEYQTQINSPFADMKNTGGREAGSVTAACFLARFTRSYRWAHLDIAGTAYRGTGNTKGATGRPVTTLTQYLMNKADA